jgi:hypothetical protein
MSRLQQQPLLERPAIGEDLHENNEAQHVAEVRRPDDDGNHAPPMSRPSFLTVLLGALSAWSV